MNHWDPSYEVACPYCGTEVFLDDTHLTTSRVAWMCPSCLATIDMIWMADV